MQKVFQNSNFQKSLQNKVGPRMAPTSQTQVISIQKLSQNKASNSFFILSKWLQCYTLWSFWFKWQKASAIASYQMLSSPWRLSGPLHVVDRRGLGDYKFHASNLNETGIPTVSESSVAQIKSSVLFHGDATSVHLGVFAVLVHQPKLTMHW